MRLNYKKEKGITVIEFIGELDNHTAHKSKQTVDLIIAEMNTVNYIFDFGKLEFMDSSGIGMLLGSYKIIKSKGGNIFVRNISSHIDKVFKVSGLYQVLTKIDY